MVLECGVGVRVWKCGIGRASARQGEEFEVIYF